MPRRPRIVIPQMPLHVIQRGNNRQACFFADEDYRRYLDWLREYAGELGCDIHAYVLTTNHVHLLLTPREADSVGRLMKRLGQRYVQYVNRVYQRSGTLWEGRFKSCLTQEEQYVLGCYRYIELNPVRAGMVEHPADYPWTSYRINAQNEKSELVTPHPLYGSSPDRVGSLAVKSRMVINLLYKNLRAFLLPLLERLNGRDMAQGTLGDVMVVDLPVVEEGLFEILG